METLIICSPRFRTTVRMKEISMLILCGSAAIAAIAGAIHALRKALDGLPRSNRDWVFY
ncbi:hypothetical protein [Acidovorax sp. A1169]|uniref:hypothetical protein n=1 Tax=Acidovorax sp. A1169 TaxID=3059524 RepID=UPI002737EADB|nr:hypothetical protein [Acidovorax sp. A1169]MDP4075469.1 hypothetical protein [Acidovorax sp. A1169]